jgi:hypothetical protein
VLGEKNRTRSSLESRMKIKKSESGRHEPLLNAVARRIGHAAGAVSKMTQEFTETLSAAPKAITAKMRDQAKVGNPTERPQGRRRAKKDATTSHKRNVKRIAKKRSPAVGKSRRSRRRKPAKINN